MAVVSHNHTRSVWVLKCDIKKFFASINHKILKNILKKHIEDKNIIWLFNKIIDSFHGKDNVGVGLPLGNLTSQLLVNIYMNEFDQFLKRTLKIHYCVRYADDFVILHESKECLENLIPKISNYLETELKLSLHPSKVFIKTFASGVDFLGWVHFPYRRVLRTSTKKRILKLLKRKASPEILTSYSGLLSHGDAYELFQSL